MANAYLIPVVTTPTALSLVAATREVQIVITVAITDTTTQANTYVVGMGVRLRIPKTYGMIQADGQFGTIVEIVGNDMKLNIDSRLYDPFMLPIFTSLQWTATIAPAGSRNLEYNNFTNKVPFQSLNNRGN
jgi:hypothetical protein